MPSQKSSAERRSDWPFWFWLLMIAPGRVVTLHSRLPPDEISRRLQAASSAKVLTPYQASIRLPLQNNQRRFFLWFEPNPGGTLLKGQMQTPYRVALSRLIIAGVLFFLALYWFMAARVWVGVFFLLFAAGFLLLSQYERVIGRDLRLHLDWIRKTLDAE